MRSQDIEMRPLLANGGMGEVEEARARRKGSKRVGVMVGVMIVVLGIVGLVLTLDRAPTQSPHDAPTLKNRLVSVTADRNQRSGELNGGNWEGDIMATKKEIRKEYGPNVNLEGVTFAEEEKESVKGDDLTAYSSKLWPGGIIYYSFNGNLKGNSRGDMEWAMRHIECLVPGLYFRRRSNQAYYLDIKDGGGCSSYVGRRWSGYQPQPVVLASNCGRGAAVHELLHAAGVWHEQSRPDRDKFVNIHLDNVDGNDKKHNFDKRLAHEVNSRGFPYDYGSIMHYGSTAFGKAYPWYMFWKWGQRKTTISKKLPGSSIGQRNGLSGNDVMQMRTLYQPRNVFFVVSVHSGKVMDVSGVSRSNGANIHQWGKHGGRNQMWIIPATNQWVSVKGVNSGAYWDIHRGSGGNGGNLIQWQFHGGNNQQFKFVPLGGGVYRILARHSNKCLDVSGFGHHHGANIHQWDCHNGNNQKWRLQTVPVRNDLYFIVSADSGKVMDCQGGHRGNNVHLWEFHGDHQQQFYVSGTQRWTFVTCRRGGTVLDISGGHGGNGGNLHVWPKHGGNNQQFMFQSVGGGNFKIVARHSGRVLDVAGAHKHSGANIHQWAWHGGANQKWQLVRVPNY